jgi:hypothetical protein
MISKKLKNPKTNLKIELEVFSKIEKVSNRNQRLFLK